MNTAFKIRIALCGWTLHDFSPPERVLWSSQRRCGERRRLRRLLIMIDAGSHQTAARIACRKPQVAGAIGLISGNSCAGFQGRERPCPNLTLGCVA